MKRFLMLVGAAVVAAAMYVAASPASQQSKGPTAKQFAALKAQVATMNKNLKALKTLATAEAVLLGDCAQVAVPIDQFGDNTAAQTEGYMYSQPSGTPQQFLTTALDVSNSSDTGALYITGGDASCGALFGGNELRNAAAKAGIRLHAASHLPTFTAHGR